MSAPSTVRLPAAYPDGEWQLQARCRRYGSERFSVENEGYGQHTRRERAAKKICFQCPVCYPCHNHAVAVGEPCGV